MENVLFGYYLWLNLVVPIKITIPYKYKNTEIMSISGLAEPIQNISSYNQTTNHEEIGRTDFLCWNQTFSLPDEKKL